MFVTFFQISTYQIHILLRTIKFIEPQSEDIPFKKFICVQCGNGGEWIS